MTAKFSCKDRAKAVKNFRKRAQNRPSVHHDRQISIVSAMSVNSPTYIETSEASLVEIRTESLQKKFDELERLIKDKDKYLH